MWFWVTTFTRRHRWVDNPTPFPPTPRHAVVLSALPLLSLDFIVHNKKPWPLVLLPDYAASARTSKENGVADPTVAKEGWRAKNRTEHPYMRKHIKTLIKHWWCSFKWTGFLIAIHKKKKLLLGDVEWAAEKNLFADLKELSNADTHWESAEPNENAIQNQSTT